MRDAMCADAPPTAGLYFGARNGAVWASADAGESWRQIVANLPDVLVVRAAALPATGPAAMMRPWAAASRSRSATIQADPARVHGLINDFHEWTAWSPWEDVDPDLQRTYTGPTPASGALRLEGQPQGGGGSMEITAPRPSGSHRAGFLKPFRNTQQVAFVLTPTGTGTDVTWRMTGEHEGMMRPVQQGRLDGQAGRQGLREGPDPAQGRGRGALRRVPAPG